MNRVHCGHIEWELFALPQQMDEWLAGLVSPTGFVKDVGVVTGEDHYAEFRLTEIFDNFLSDVHGLCDLINAYHLETMFSNRLFNAPQQSVRLLPNSTARLAQWRNHETCFGVP